MSYDLLLGFKTKPMDLDATLASQGFKHVRTIEPTDPNRPRPQELFTIQMRFYEHKDGIEFRYTDGLSQGELWCGNPNLGEVVAQATISTGSGNSQGQKKQEKLGKLLRVCYGAYLSDPQTGQLLKD